MTKPGTPRRNNRRRRRPGRRRSNESQQNLPTCPVCEKRIRDLSSAVAHQETGEPAHFDCIVRILTEREDLENGEKICYLGNGSFGIVQQRVSGHPLRFFIRKRIQYEPKDAQLSWRTNLQAKIRR